MAKFKPAEVRQLEQLLQKKIIPWAQNAAPLHLFDAPPRTSMPVDIRERSISLPVVHPNQSYPQIYRWREQGLNSISVTVLGCIFEGEATYRVHAPPVFGDKRIGSDDREWMVPLAEGSLFAIVPNTPFSDGSKVAWEYPTPASPTLASAYSRGILMHLRRDGVACHTFTCDKGKLRAHPYVFLYQLEASLLGEKLLNEMRALSGTTQPVASLYWQLILRLLLRSIQLEEYSALDKPLDSPELIEYQHPLHRLSPERIIEATTEFIQSRLSDPLLTSRVVAQHIGLSERHLNRHLGGHMQVSLFQYIQQQRSLKARELLSHSGISISDVATYCGFRRLSAFSAWFSKYHHVTPSEYRYSQQPPNVKNL